MKFSKSLSQVLLALLVLGLIVFIIFGRTLNSYFLEDDFGEVLYVSQIFAGDWQKIIANFTGNYMQIPTMKVYRPCLLLSLMIDYALWQTQAFGYFLTNIFFLLGTSFLLYLVLRALSKSWSNVRSFSFALVGAAIFAANPLHCESVSLMVGRVDIICAFFYLLALWAFIYKGNKKKPFANILAIISFWIALLTKEMAIGLPILLTSICFLFPEILNSKPAEGTVFSTDTQGTSFLQRTKLAIQLTYQFWLSCLFYFVIRYLTLGTFVGGYTGSVGAIQASHIIEKWTDLDTLFRILFPLNKSIFGQQCIYHPLLAFIYIAILLIALVKIFTSSTLRSWLGFTILWALTTLAPIYQLWGLGYNLEGARFLFFLTMPLSVILPLIVFAPDGQRNKLVSEKNINFIPATLALLSLIVIDTKIAAKNNIPWVHAGKQTKALLAEGEKLAQSLAPEQKVILLGIPKETDGAHILYNGMTFNFIMSPPFTKEPYFDHFITFDPILFGNANVINKQRFKEELSKPNIIGVYVWQKDNLQFKNIALTKTQDPHTQHKTIKAISIPLPNKKDILFPYTAKRGLWQLTADKIEISDCLKGTGISIGPLTIEPLAYDFLEIQASISPKVDNKSIKVLWPCNEQNIEEKGEAQASSTYPSSQLPTWQTYRFALSRQWRWFLTNKLDHLLLELPPAQAISIGKIRLINDKYLVPTITVNNKEADNTGVYTVEHDGLSIEIKAKDIEDCVKVRLVISKPNYFFDSLDSDKEAIDSQFITGCTGKVCLDSKLFSPSAFHQIRAIALDKNDNILGEWSDPITIRSHK